MKTLDVKKFAGLARYAHNASREAIILTENKKPIAALVSLDDADLECISLSSNPDFLAMLEKSRARQAAEGGVTLDQARRQLGLAVSAGPRRRRRNGKK
jgi:hypothetical protein